MKKLLIVISILSIAISCKKVDPQIEWPDEPMPIFEAIFLLPKEDKVGEFIENVKNHNEKYHNKTEGTSTSLRYITAGAKSGYYVWVEGPMSLAYIDEKSSVAGHQEDWQTNVAPLIKKEGGANFYRLATPLSYTSSSANYSANVLDVRAYSVKEGRGNGQKVNILLHKFKKAFEAGKSDREWRTFSPIRDDGSNRDFYIVWPLESMAQFDTWDFNVNKYLDEIYGKNANQEIWKQWNDLVNLEESDFRMLVK